MIHRGRQERGDPSEGVWNTHNGPRQATDPTGQPPADIAGVLAAHHQLDSLTAEEDPSQSSCSLGTPTGGYPLRPRPETEASPGLLMSCPGQICIWWYVRLPIHHALTTSGFFPTSPSKKQTDLCLLSASAEPEPRTENHERLGRSSCRMRS
jgi:hypothetical protein